MSAAAAHHHGPSIGNVSTSHLDQEVEHGSIGDGCLLLSLMHEQHRCQSILLGPAVASCQSGMLGDGSIPCTFDQAHFQTSTSLQRSSVQPALLGQMTQWA